MYHDADIIDIREYVRVKTVPGGNSERNECHVIHGIVCSKNVAHKCMQGRRLQPKILLLTCPLVYQRNEGKYMGLGPVLLQVKFIFQIFFIYNYLINIEFVSGA